MAGDQPVRVELIKRYESGQPGGAPGDADTLFLTFEATRPTPVGTLTAQMDAHYKLALADDAELSADDPDMVYVEDLRWCLVWGGGLRTGATPAPGWDVRFDGPSRSAVFTLRAPEAGVPARSAEVTLTLLDITVFQPPEMLELTADERERRLAAG